MNEKHYEVIKEIHKRLLESPTGVVRIDSRGEKQGIDTISLLNGEWIAYVDGNTKQNVHKISDYGVSWSLI